MTNEDLDKLKKVIQEERERWLKTGICTADLLENIMYKMSLPKKRKYQVIFQFVSRKTSDEINARGQTAFDTGLKKFIADYYAPDVNDHIFRHVGELTED